jgi:hypothetical protein
VEENPSLQLIYLAQMLQTKGMASPRVLLVVAEEKLKEERAS